MSAFNPRQMFLLDEACRPIRDAFNEAPYLVGTAGSREGAYRDVDVRLIMSDKRYAKLLRAMGADGIAFLGLAIGQYLASRTGLPIDFQIQQQTAANHHHPDGMRNPLGGRKLRSYRGDAPLVPAAENPRLSDE